MSMEDFEAKKYGATARVTITLEVNVSGAWGGKCSVAQVAKQATDEATGRVHDAISRMRSGGDSVRLIGEPVVTAIFTKEKEG